jgi:hypothetical protein
MGGARFAGRAAGSPIWISDSAYPIDQPQVAITGVWMPGLSSVAPWGAAFAIAGVAEAESIATDGLMGTGLAITANGTIYTCQSSPIVTQSDDALLLSW